LAAALLESGLHIGTHLLVGRFTHLGHFEVMQFNWFVLILPAIGGLLSGLLMKWLAPNAVGHGTDVLTRAFHTQQGDLPLRGPSVRAVANIGVISFGGSTGPEGPISALGAAIGSTIGKIFGLTPRERRIMLIAGCGGGVGAIFQCPLGGALFAAGIIYREPEFESDAIVPAFIAGVISYSTYGVFWEYGGTLIENANKLVFDSPLALIPYIVLGPLCGLLAGFLGFCLKTVEHRPLARFNLPRWLTPALGGLCVGLLACALPQVMDGMYQFTQNVMNGDFLTEYPEKSWWYWTALFALVTVTKCVATALTVGSGGAGGVLGPSVFVGGTAGAFVGALGMALLPEGWITEDLRQALIPVGMAGVLSASMRVPLAAIVMTTEMTGSYGLIVPLMLVCVTSYVVGKRWGLNHEQVRGVAESPAHAGDALVHNLEAWRVGETMIRDWPATVPVDATLTEIVGKLRPGTRPVFAVLEHERLVGVISLPDLDRIMEDAPVADIFIAKDLMTENVRTINDDQTLYDALNIFNIENHDVLPVVEHTKERRFVGMLPREAVHAMVRKEMDRMRSHLLTEHKGLATIDRDEQLGQLISGVGASRPDRIQRLFVPIQAIGKSLRETDFRREFGAQVVAIELPDGTIQCPPDPDMPLKTNHRLTAIVWEKPGESHPSSVD
jgi:CIC family chloride channel protein